MEADKIHCPSTVNISEMAITSEPLDQISDHAYGLSKNQSEFNFKPQFNFGGENWWRGLWEMMCICGVYVLFPFLFI